MKLYDMVAVFEAVVAHHTKADESCTNFLAWRQMYFLTVGKYG